MLWSPHWCVHACLCVCVSVCVIERARSLSALFHPSHARPTAASQLYTQHTLPVTAVAVAPSGCWVASGDAGGNLRVWACDHPEQSTKLETPGDPPPPPPPPPPPVIGGKILDISWSPDSQR